MVVYDTDPVNATSFAGYKALNTQRPNLCDGSLVERNFDRLIEQIVEQDSDFVVDNGVLLLSPLVVLFGRERRFINLIAENGKQVYIHTVITGVKRCAIRWAALLRCANKCREVRTFGCVAE